MKWFAFVVVGSLISLLGCQEEPRYSGGQDQNIEEDQVDRDVEPRPDLAPGDDLTPPDLPPDPPTEDVPPSIDICEDFCPGGYVCRGGAVYACTQQPIGCGSPCPCDAPVDEAVCAGPCVEGAFGEQPGDVCARDACLCASDADCGQDNVVCLDCQCVAQGDGACLEVCAERRNRELGEGFCPVEYLDAQRCEGACGRLVTQGQAELQQVALSCLRDDPLCFRSLSDCIFLQIYGEQAMARFQIRGERFERWEGAAVFAAFVVDDAPRLVASAEIRSGRWAVAWDALTWPGDRSQAVIWVDADGDGVCGDTEPVQFVELRRDELFLELVYEGEADPNAPREGQLCAWF